MPLSNKDLGYLPGDINSKLEPYMEPLFDNLSVIRLQFKKNDQRAIKINQLLEEDKLLLTPLAYIRGRSLQNVYFIIDEAQNLTPHEIKTIITRSGEGTKIVFTGDTLFALGCGRLFEGTPEMMWNSLKKLKKLKLLNIKLLILKNI